MRGEGAGGAFTLWFFGGDCEEEKWTQRVKKSDIHIYPLDFDFSNPAMVN